MARNDRYDERSQQLEDADYWRSTPQMTDDDDEEIDGDWDDCEEADDYRRNRALYKFRR